MSRSDLQRHWKTVVIGAGQAGLAVGYHLALRGEDFVILDAESRVGDAWRRRWDSLRLFTPAKYDGLPGMPFPLAREAFPLKDQVADYLSAYAERFALPVRSGVRVERLERTPDGFRIHSGEGALTATRVVLATGTNPVPRVPPFAGELSPEIRQLHSSQYRNPESVGPGRVLVVGAGTSGVEIALELAKRGPTFLAGRPTQHIPDAVFRYAGGLYWWLLNHVLTVRTPIGRRARPAVLGGGAPLIRVSADELGPAGVVRLPRVSGVSGGRPRTEDGATVEVDTIIWATGFRPDFEWVGFPVTDETGWPAGSRGVSSAAPGLYYVGMPFQTGLTSGLLGGVGRDAAYVAGRMSPVA